MLPFRIIRFLCKLLYLPIYILVYPTYIPDVIWHVYMARKSIHLEPRQVAFDADAFDLPADNCAALSITPFLSDTYEAEPIENAELAGVGHAKCTHIGKVLWEVRDDNRLPLYIINIERF